MRRSIARKLVRSSVRGVIRVSIFNPLNLNPVMWLDGTDGDTITLNGTSVAQWDDKSGNDSHAVQATASEQPLFNTAGTYSYIDFDNVDDFMTYDVGTYTGQIGIATKNGTYVANCSYSGSFDMPAAQPFGIVAIVIADSINEDAFKKYAVNLGAAASFGDVTSFFQAWKDRIDITSFPVIDVGGSSVLSQTWIGCINLTSFPLIDTSMISNFQFAWQGCSSLASFPLLDSSSVTIFNSSWRDCSSLAIFPLIDTSLATTFNTTWYGCSSLTSFPLIDTALVSNFKFTWRFCTGLTSFPALNFGSATIVESAWEGCTSLATFPANVFDSTTCTNFTKSFTNTALTEASIDNILVSINTANTSSGTFDQTGGSAPSATGEAAITAMRARGWTISVTGGF